jgi:hypothetical protein
MVYIVENGTARKAESRNHKWTFLFLRFGFLILQISSILTEVINYQDILNFPFDSLCRRFGQIGLAQPHRVTVLN